MDNFDFKKFEQNIPKFANLLKTQMQTRLFHPIAPDFDVKVAVVTRKWKEKKIDVETTGLAKHMNFHMFAEVWLHNFGGGVLKESDHYWLPIDWRWTSTNGGGNGTTAFTCYVNDNGEIVKGNP